MGKQFNTTLQAVSRKLSLLAFMALVSVMGAFAQVTGTVTDENDDPLPGVTVLIKGSQQGVSTDIDGNFTIDAKGNSTLIFRYVGMITQEVKVDNRKHIDVVLKEDDKTLDEVVVIGYGSMKRGAVTSAVSTVSGKEILKAPTMSMSNVIGGRVSGIATVQTSGQPGVDAASITLRGQGNVVYIVDGVRRTSDDFNQIDPNEIESISVLKDASAVAVYGLDANGAIIVTTKQGNNEKTSINYTGTFGWSHNALQQTWLDGPGYAYWYNRAYALDHDMEWGPDCYPVFTQEAVNSMRLGINGWGNTNWYDKLWGTGTRTSHNVSASGGSEKYKFFVSLGYLKENGNLKNFDNARYNLRSNINAKITKNLTFDLGVSGRILDRHEPYMSADPDAYMNIPEQIVRSLPFLPEYTTYNGKTYPVGSWGGNVLIAAPGEALNNSGYSKTNTTVVSTNLSLRYDAPFLKGLYAKFTGAYDASFTNQKRLATPYQVIRGYYDTSTIGLASPQYGKDGNGKPEVSDQPGNVSVIESTSRAYTITSQTSIGYNNSFNGHNIGVLALGETREYRAHAMGVSGYGLNFISLDELSNLTNLGYTGATMNPSPVGNTQHSRVAGFVFRGNYSYDDRYFAELTMRYDGSYLFGGMNKRWVALPGVSVGWRIDREKFFTADWIQNFKLRAGYGQTATSGLSPLMWRNTMGIYNNALIIGGIGSSSIYPAVLGNPHLTWSKANNYNVGVDLLLWNGLLNVEADVFYKYEYDKLSSVTGAYPPSMGGYYYTTGNENAIDYRGFDMTFTHNNRIGKVGYGAKLIFSYAYARWVKYAGDSANLPEWQRLAGKQVGVKRGMIAEGLFQSWEEIENSPTPAQKVRPGYVKYKDLNGDGKIVAPSAGAWGDDDGYFGKSHTPKYTGSLDLNANWNGFDFDMLWAWGLDCEVALTGLYTQSGSAHSGVQDHTSFTRPFYEGGNSPIYLVENAWTPENPNAEFPRLEATMSYSNNNGYASSLWYRNGNYLRLKTAQIGYTFPQKWIGRSGITKLRVYAEGYNLLTFSELNKYNIDPESPAVNNGYYPQQRTFAVGVNVSF
ncbi:MAG: TonB-dependent receptor [Muribaculaceae bacterium]|nr:TonB-dependent receptor [Muribaculaceae bacterium]